MNSHKPPAPSLLSPMYPQRRFNKRKKAGGRKTLKRKRMLKKALNLTDNLKPIPFIPRKELDFDKHQEVLKRLGLLEFSKIGFDRSIRTDLIVQLIVNYDSKKRCSYVSDTRIVVNRADLARALKLPAPKQDKGSTTVDEVDLDLEVFSDEAIVFIDKFVTNCMLLHEESWVMPTEIANWIRCIKDGHPEKLDSASLIWYMVEKELTQGNKLSDCYYASHLQHLIKSQLDSIFYEDDDDGVEDDDEDQEVEEERDQEEQGEEEECGQRVDEGFEHGMNDDSMDRDRLKDNILGVEIHNIPSKSHEMSSMDLFGSRDNSFMSHGGLSFNNGGKRVMEPEEGIHHLDINNKRLKTKEIWADKRNEFGLCMEQMQQLKEKAKMLNDSIQQSCENLQYSQQYAMNVLNERQNYMQMIMKSKDEELEKKNAEVIRLERELYLMTDLLSQNKKALYDTRTEFSEYRKRYALQEESLYKDAGPGGLVLRTRELEKQQLKQEEDKRVYQMLAKIILEDFVYQMKMHNDKVLSMFDKLVSIGNEVKQLKEMAAKCKGKQKLVVENVKSGEFEANQKSLNEQDVSLKHKENQESRVEIVKKDASVESVPLNESEVTKLLLSLHWLSK